MISENTLAKLRRGAEHLFRKYKDSLSEATVTIKQEVAKELGIAVKEVQATPVPAVPESFLGLFDDEPNSEMVTPDVMVNVKLTDYIKALQSYKVKTPKEMVDLAAKKEPPKA